jgi:dihydroxyacetone kinase-like protein
MINVNNVKKWIYDISDVYNEQKIYLSELDSAIGDGDHGVNMARGFEVVVSQWEKTPPADLASAFKLISMSLIKSVGGASGPLYGTFFMKAAAICAGKQEIDLAQWIEILEKGIEGISKMGGNSQKGDKTMLDALYPALDALKVAKNNGKTLNEALNDSQAAAEKGREDTIPMQAKKGRASYLGERSIGHQDPGATSLHLLLKSAAQNLID